MAKQNYIIPYGFNGDKVMEVFGYEDIHDACNYMHYLGRKTKNTESARKLARIYNEMVETPFPGGEENAFIQRLYPGHWQRSSGAWSWLLSARASAWQQDQQYPLEFGSQYTVKQCLADNKLIE